MYAPNPHPPTTSPQIPMSKYRLNPFAPFLICLFAISGCSVSQYIPAGETFYAGVKDIKYSDKDEGHNATLARKEVESVLAEKPNNNLLGSARTRIPTAIPFYIHKNFAGSQNFFGRWLYKNFGSAPKLISEVRPELRTEVARQRLREFGYFRSDVMSEVMYQGRDSVVAKVRYDVLMGKPYLMDSIQYRIPIHTEDSLDFADPKERLLQTGDAFGVLSLENERQRISNLLRHRGYFYFKPEHIIYKADTIARPEHVQVRVELSPEMLPEAYEPWHIGSITYDLYDVNHNPLTDSVTYDGILFRYHRRPPVRLSTLRPRTKFVVGDLYNQNQQLRTQESVHRLNTFQYTGVEYARDTTRGSNLLNVTLTSQLDLPYYTELEGTYKFKSNNQTGPGVAFSVNRKNLLRAGELLSITLQGSYEWLIGQRYSSGQNWNIDSYELSLTNSLTFPKLLLPYYTGLQLQYPVSSRIDFGGAIFNRGAFYRQAQLSAGITYTIEPTTRMRHTFQPLSFTYNHLLRETDRFKDAIAANPALGLSFQNQVIPQMNYLFSYEYQHPTTPQLFSLQLYVAEAGNLFSLFYKHDPSKTAQLNKFLGALYAQFLKGWLELRYSYRFTPSLQLATRAYGGAIFSYGNQLVSPYTEQFYAGGANSLRGFNVRNIGPGAYIPMDDNPMNFLERTGDLRLEANAELRYKVIGDLEVATFLDAGNIWLLRQNESKPGGNISGKHFFEDIALSTGLGVRYDLGFLVLRVDFGLALHRPDRSGGEYFNTFGRQEKPYAVHIAIGYPF